MGVHLLCRSTRLLGRAWRQMGRHGWRAGGGLLHHGACDDSAGRQAGRQAGVAGQNKTVHGVFHALMAGQTTVRV
jgi:hypothetical protein